ncbi:MAG: hypothetical protein K9K37_07170 [Desulfocapsa sp.]|nr:hypothetical protein [Desulfocapsa sp.]
MIIKIFDYHKSSASDDFMDPRQRHSGMTANLQLDDIITKHAAAHDCHSRILLSGSSGVVSGNPACSIIYLRDDTYL